MDNKRDLVIHSMFSKMFAKTLSFLKTSGYKEMSHFRG